MFVRSLDFHFSEFQEKANYLKIIPNFIVFVFKSLLALYFLYITWHYWFGSLLEKLIPNELTRIKLSP